MDGIGFWGSLLEGNSLVAVKKSLRSWRRCPKFCSIVEVLENRMAHHVAVHSAFKSPQYWIKLCFRVPPRLQEDRKVGGGVWLVVWMGLWMGLGAVYPQETPCGDLEKPRELVEGPGVLSQCGGSSREAF